MTVQQKDDFIKKLEKTSITTIVASLCSALVFSVGTFFYVKYQTDANTEAIFAGGSSGAAVWACLELARRVGGNARIVTILSDSANRYLSTIYNDDWLRQKFGDGWEPPAA